MTSPMGMSDPSFAIRLRDVVRRMAGDEISKASTNPQVARVVSIDLGDLTATVWLPGDPEPIKVRMLPNLIPADIGDNRDSLDDSPTSSVGPGSLVIIETIRRDLYITYILSGGQFAYNLQVAGMTNKMFNASYEEGGTGFGKELPVVSGQYSKRVDFYVNGTEAASNDFMMVGPFSSNQNGTFLSGAFRMVITGDTEEVRVYEFTLGNKQGWRTLGTAYEPRWMRIIPNKTSHTSSGVTDDFFVEVGVRNTSYRTEGGEIWFRFGTMLPDSFLNVLHVSLESFGGMLAFGDPNTGRLIMELDTLPTDFAGYLGFHDSSHGNYPRQEQLLTTDPGYTPSHEWDSGPYRSGILRLANDISKVWGYTGHFTWDGSNIKWDGSIVLGGVGPNYHGLYSGRWDLPMPPLATKIPVFPGVYSGSIASVTRAVVAGGIPLNPGDVLYFGLPPSVGPDGDIGDINWPETLWATTNQLWFIVDSETYDAQIGNYQLPEWAIPIARRGYATEQVKIRLMNPQAHEHMTDSTKRLSLYMSTASAALAGATATKTFDIPSFTFRVGCAYRVKFKTGVVLPTVPSYMQFWLRKGNLAGGAVIIDWLRIHASVLNQHMNFYSEMYITNTTGADITTVTNITAFSSVASGIHWNNNTSGRGYIEFEYVGAATKYPYAVPIT